MGAFFLILAVIAAFIPVVFKLEAPWAYLFPVLTLLGVILAWWRLRAPSETLAEENELLARYSDLEFTRPLSLESATLFKTRLAQFVALIAAQFSTLARQSSLLSEVRNFVQEVFEKLVSYSEKTDRFALNLLDISSKASQDVETLSRALTDLNTAAGEIAGSITHTAQKTSEARERAMQAKETMEKLLQSSEKIGSVAQVINEIAEQTNLLALNATIEAARAGEAGKGFAVVANEVKELARQTAEATKEITETIKAIQEDTHQAVSAVEGITSGVLEIDDLANTIASASEEQTATISDLTHNIENVRQVVEETHRSVEKLMEHTKEFNQLRWWLEASRFSIENIAFQNQVLLAGLKVEENFWKIEEQLQLPFRLRILLLKHYDWINQVSKGLILRKPPEVEVDPEACPLGEFLTSYQPKAQTATILEELKPTHAQLHHKVTDLQHLLTQGDHEAALALFKEEIHPTFLKMVELFNRWIAAEGGRKVELQGVERKKVFFPWNPSLATGILEIDQQHQRLVSLVNRLYQSVERGGAYEELKAILNELIEYTNYHFKTEEYYFDKYGYPEGEIHKEIHRKLTEKVLDFKRKFENREATVSYDLLDFLKDWLVNHIGKTDKKYAPFLKEKGL